ncbi:hypothetical protein YK48G_19000 [Lentilactobacillus fungorum]|uniref:Uncharacterized protein n=1 Tax=Lentilactobacillus fungorum TaxID=2201250 RepID=A0ABQ3W0W9_9LACO|nr:hypothetical protein [Lentilactobacillus fungorum]GHP14475.1 hypothetical protein YK48G_19000 [Lentilactobacillus fungorum]
MTSDNSKKALNNQEDQKQVQEEPRHKPESIDVPNQEATDDDQEKSPAWNDESPDTEFNDPRKSET